MSGELQLRLLVEDVIATRTRDLHQLAAGVRDIANGARLVRAAGGISAALAADIVAEAEFALFVRGAGALAEAAFALPEIDLVRPWQDRGRLVSVLAVGDTLAEAWEHALTIRTAGGESWTSAGGVPPGHERVEVRSSMGTASLDMGRAMKARRAAVVVRPIGFVETMVAWAAIAEPALLARLNTPTAGWNAQEHWEPLAIAAGDITLTAIEAGTRLYGTVPEVAVGWIRTPAGVHLLEPERDGVAIAPALPPAADPAWLVLVDDGLVTEVRLR